MLQRIKQSAWGLALLVFFVAAAILFIANLSGCSATRARTDPPAVTGCLERPTSSVPDEPEAPAAGAPITDAYVVSLKGFANALLGVITADRIGWRGERKCISAIRDAGQIQ